ncbi:MAG: hypothetical protein H7337_10025 [Rhizobacter sp.]|nr:hypothetical protein [Rhizobacter sp.]
MNDRLQSLGFPGDHCCPRGFKSCIRGSARIVGRSKELARATKQSAVIALCMRPSSSQAVAEEFCVSRGSLYKWKNQLLGHDAPASMKHQQDAPASPDRAELEQQFETLRRDIRRLQLEKDLLKKANELLKKEVGIDRQSLTSREKTQLVVRNFVCEA